MAEPVDIFAEEKALKDAVEGRAAAATPAPAPNPYKPGTEEADWYQRQLDSAKSPASPDSFAADLPPTGNGPVAPPAPAYHGGLLPFSRDSSGGFYFDPWNAGPTGAMKQAVTLPGRVYSGETPMPRTFDPSVVSRAQTSPIMGDVLNMATSMPGSPLINPAIRSGDRAIAGVGRNVDLGMATPPGAELRSVGGQQLNSFRNFDIGYSPGYVGGPMATAMEQKLLDLGILPGNSKQLYGFVKGLKKNVPISDDPTATTSLSPGNLMAMRDNITALYGKPKEHQKGVSEVHAILDNFIKNPPAEAIVGGPSSIAAPYAGTVFERGLANSAAGLRDRSLEKIQSDARLRTLSANSGLNADNSLRSRITSALIDAKKTRGFNPEEKAALEVVPEGTIPTNTRRYLGNLLGGGGGLGAHLAGAAGFGLGTFMGGPSMGWLTAPVLPAIGTALKASAGRGTAEALNAARTLTRQRSPLFRENLAGADVVPAPAWSDALPMLTPSQDPRAAITRTMTRTMTDAEGTPLSPEDQTALRRIIIDRPASVEEKP